MNFDSSSLNNLVLITTGFASAFLVALWLSLIFWVGRDIQVRTKDRLVRILAVLVTAVLFLPGVLIYLLLRPNRTLEDDYQQSLEEEAMLQSIEGGALCPGCGRRLENDWVACPSCYARLKKNCSHCGRLMELPWNLCPYCGKTVPGVKLEELHSDEIG